MDNTNFYAEHYAEVKLCREFVDDYCRLVAEVYDYAVKQGEKDDHLLFAFASDCAEAYVNEHIVELPRLKSIYKADWQQEFILKLHDRMIDGLETEDDIGSVLDIPSSSNRTHTKLISDHIKLEECNDDKERASLLQVRINELQDLIQKMQSLKDKARQNVFDEWKQTTKEKFPEFRTSEKGYYVDVTIDMINGKRVIALISQERTQLYCQVQFDDSLPQKERNIENSKLMTLKDILPLNNWWCIYKYFQQDDYDGVFNLFIEVVERCKKLLD